jgi:hypothetical protein
MKVKVLSLWQPWASLVAGRFKQSETRSWNTTHRGILAIHATKSEPRWVNDLMNGRLHESNQLFWECLGRMGYEAFPQLPRGAVVALVELTSVFPTQQLRNGLKEQELTFGDWRPGRFAWVFSAISRLSEPIPAVGRQGLWEWEMPLELEATLLIDCWNCGQKRLSSASVSHCPHCHIG